MTLLWLAPDLPAISQLSSSSKAKKTGRMHELLSSESARKESDVWPLALDDGIPAASQKPQLRQRLGEGSELG